MDRLAHKELGISLFFAFRGFVAELERVRKLTEITHDEKETNVLGEGTEDGTLGKLCNFTDPKLMVGNSAQIGNASKARG